MLDRKHLHGITRDLGHEELCQLLSWVTAKLDTREGTRVRVPMSTVFFPPPDRPDSVVYTAAIPGDLMVLPETLGTPDVNPLRGAQIQWYLPDEREIVGTFYGAHEGGTLHFDRDWGGGPVPYFLRKPAAASAANSSYLVRGSVSLLVEIPRAWVASPPHLIFDRSCAPLLALNP